MFRLMTTKKRKLGTVGLEQPLSIGTVTAKDLDEIERELLACQSNICDCMDSIRDSATDHLVVVITDAKGKIVSFVDALDLSWFPSILWVAPAFERQGFGAMMSMFCDKLAALHEEVLMCIEDVVDNEGFWNKQGYARREDLELIEVSPGRNMMFKLLLKVDLSEDDEAQGLLENHRDFLTRPTSSDQVTKQLDLCWPKFALRVGVFVSVFNDSSSNGVFAFATLDKNYLIFANTLCLPVKTQDSDWTLAIHIITPDHPEPVLRIAMKLDHLTQAANVGNAVLFNCVEVPARCHMRDHIYPGVSDVKTNTLARSWIGRHGVVDLRNSKMNLMQLVAAHANQREPWKVQLSLQ